MLFQVHSSSEDVVVGGSVDGVEIVEDLDRGTSTLTVLSTSVDAEAQYTCRVRNSRGTAFTNAHLFVLRKCSGPHRTHELHRCGLCL